MWSSPHQALKSVEASMQDHVIGTGLNHLVSKRHLELRSSAFEFHHRQHATLLHSSSVDALLPQPSTPYVSFSVLLVTYVCCSTECLRRLYVFTFLSLTPSLPAVPNCCCLKGPAPHWSNPPFLIFDIRALWRSGLSARVPECQKLKTVG